MVFEKQQKAGMGFKLEITWINMIPAACHELNGNSVQSTQI